jgi:nitroimidazol reductase NimA-like FMN-containing flavoprotein (pyridoxamine 5'-phosphate oxidase superfamily)
MTMEATPRSTFRRKRERGTHDLGTIYSILDEGLVCHVGFEENGSVFVVPTAYARVEDDLYLHGAAANRMLKQLASGSQACVTVTLLDGVVFARSAFHHSMNYRCAMVFGTASKVEDPGEKRRAVTAIVDHMAEGRSADARPPTDVELRATSVVKMPLREASAKIRTGGPLDEDDDLGLRIWAGELPLRTVAADPVPDPHLPEDVERPSYLTTAGDEPRRRST